MAGDPIPKTYSTKSPRKRLPARSAKRAAISGERAEFVRDMLRRRPLCEFPGIASGFAGDDDDRLEVGRVIARCRRHSCDVHEIVGRGRGGAIVPSQGLTPGDVLCLCRSCHDWVTTHPRLGAALGALQSGASRPDLTNRKARAMTDTRMSQETWTRYVASGSESESSALAAARQVAGERAGCRVLSVVLDSDENQWLAMFEGGAR
jgi:hypothetical protein